MTEQRINPEKITKPIQLLSAWLVGLIVVNASFLLAAQQISRPDWASSLLVISAVANVPVFILALFLLQTKFRPQMQEDSYYAQYLQQERYQSVQSQFQATIAEREVEQTTEKLIESLGLQASGKENSIAEVLRKSQHEVLLHKHGPTRTLSELFLEPDTWKEVVDKYEKDPSFISDVEGLIADGLVDRANEDYRTVRLTSLGIEIANQAESKDMLFKQRKGRIWGGMRKDLLKSKA